MCSPCCQPILFSIPRCRRAQGARKIWLQPLSSLCAEVRASGQEHTHWEVYLHCLEEPSKIAHDEAGPIQLLHWDLAGHRIKQKCLIWQGLQFLYHSGPAGTLAAQGDTTFLSCTMSWFSRNPTGRIYKRQQRVLTTKFCSQCLPTAAKESNLNPCSKELDEFTSYSCLCFPSGQALTTTNTAAVLDSNFFWLYFFPVCLCVHLGTQPLQQDLAICASERVNSVQYPCDSPALTQMNNFH